MVRSVALKIPSSTGLTLAATLDRPDGEPVAYALFAHCFTCNRFAPAASRISKAMAAAGIATLRFDFPGLGQSEGVFEETSFSENVADLEAVYQWMGENLDFPQVAVGHSLGGAAVLKAAGAMEKVRAVATVGAPFDPAHAVMQFADHLPQIEADGQVHMMLAGRPMTISRSYVEDLAAANPEAYLPRLRKPLLILHSPVDQTVGIDNAQKIFLASKYPKSLVSLDRADHLMTRPGVAAHAAELIVGWARQYIEPLTGQPEDLPEGSAVARTSTEGKFFTDVSAGRQHFVMDREPSAGGGKNAGPNPTDAVAAAVAAAANHAVRQAVQKARLRQVGEVLVQAQLGDGVIDRVIRVYSEQPLSEGDRELIRGALRESTVDSLFAVEIRDQFEF